MKHLRRLWTPPLVTALCALFLVAGGPVVKAIAATAPVPYRVVWDDFHDGFTVSGAAARWSYAGDGGAYVADDGEVTTSRRGLRVDAGGVNPRTGDPAFTRTTHGVADHMKWVVGTNHQASSGFPGFDAVPGQVLSCATRLSGRTYGTGGHPFGDRVHDPDDDLRLAAVAMTTTDLETGMAFDFMLTNDRVYAFYERLPGATGSAFSFAVPVTHRSPGDSHRLRIAYDRQAGVVGWFADGVEVYRVDRIGYRTGRDHLMLDHGGAGAPASPRQLMCGLGMFTVLDGATPGAAGSALVRLSDADSFYFDTVRGEPTPQSFLDPDGRAASRLFGQGATLLANRYVVASLPRH